MIMTEWLPRAPDRTDFWRSCRYEVQAWFKNGFVEEAYAAQLALCEELRKRPKASVKRATFEEALGRYRAARDRKKPKDVP